MSEPLSKSEARESSGWSHPVRFYQPHNPAFWLTAALLILGGHHFMNHLRNLAQYPTAALMGLILLSLYSLPFIWFITRTDRYEREPARLAALGFLWGGLVATWLMSLPGNSANLSLLAKFVSIEFSTSWGASLSAPLVEESSKYCGLIVLFLLARKHVRSAYDGMILGAFVGLGFQIFENLHYVSSAVEANFGAGQVRDTLTIFTIRAVVGLWSHSLYTAVTGAGFGYLVGNPGKPLAKRLLVAVAFYLAGSVIHGCMDASLAVPVLALLAPVISLVALVVAWKFADRRQRQWMRVLLEEESTPGVVTSEELDVLSGPHKARRHYLKQIKKEQGPQEARRARLILDAQTDLAAALAFSENAEDRAVERAREEVRRVRRPIPNSED